MFEGPKNQTSLSFKQNICVCFEFGVAFLQVRNTGKTVADQWREVLSQLTRSERLIRPLRTLTDTVPTISIMALTTGVLVCSIKFIPSTSAHRPAGSASA